MAFEQNFPDTVGFSVVVNEDCGRLFKKFPGQFVRDSCYHKRKNVDGRFHIASGEQGIHPDKVEAVRLLLLVGIWSGTNLPDVVYSQLLYIRPFGQF